MNSKMKLVSLAVLSSAVALGYSASANAAPIPYINYISIDTTTLPNTITLHGTNLTSAWGYITKISTNGVDLVQVGPVTATEAVFQCPAVGVPTPPCNPDLSLIPGDYHVGIWWNQKIFNKYVPMYLTSWDLTAGAVGPQGPQGNQGPQGIQGPPGLANVEIVTAAGNGATQTATCPGTKVVLGGGGRTTSALRTVKESYPSSANAWRVEFTASIAGTQTAYAVCADVATTPP
jgi:hypothetical protein